MAKRFEGSHPSFGDVLKGYRRLGLQKLLGQPGRNTAFGAPVRHCDEQIEFFTIPGSFTEAEVRQLLRDSGYCGTA